MAQHQFPDGFIWGVATSAQQIEGAAKVDGRGESIWDRFAATPGQIKDRSCPDPACDHYMRWREDIGLLSGLGLNGYRFSIAWPRIQPTGRGLANTAGLDFYDRLVDGLLAADIAPFPTLYHWDLPQALQDAGGWAERSVVDAFGDYAGLVVERLGDRVKSWVTHNEPWCVATLGYEEGAHAPGLQDPGMALRAAHHLLLSHGRATRVIRAAAPAAEVGIVQAYAPSVPAGPGAADRDSARWFDGFFNRWYLDPLFRGVYPADAVADRMAAGHLPASGMPFVHEGDLAEIATPLDFIGLNYYSRNVMRAAADGRPEQVRMVPEEELTDMGWEVYPEGIAHSLARVHREYHVPRLYITENGAAYDDPVDADGRIRDERRIAYLQGHLQGVRRAIDQGVPVAGYFLWSLMDNFEWGDGFTRKFGLHALDPETRDRLPRDSAFWYRDVVAARGSDDVLAFTNEGEIPCTR